MDKDVVDFLLAVLDDTNFEARGKDLARLMELHNRAAEQVRAQLPDLPE